MSDVKVSVVGRSVQGKPITVVFHAGSGEKQQCALILAAMHGDEPKTVFVADNLSTCLKEAGSGVEMCDVHIVSVVNPDGYGDRRRTNANRVDLNRNFPTADWEGGRARSRYYGGPFAASEPETRAIVTLVQRVKPDFIITLHSITENRQCNNYNGRGRDLAEKLALHNGYPVLGHIGYSTPGSFGTWAGMEQDIPTITLELPSHTSRQRDWATNRSALLAAIGLVDEQ